MVWIKHLVIVNHDWCRERLTLLLKLHGGCYTKALKKMTEDKLNLRNPQLWKLLFLRARCVASTECRCYLRKLATWMKKNWINIWKPPHNYEVKDGFQMLAHDWLIIPSNSNWEFIFTICNYLTGFRLKDMRVWTPLILKI